MHKLLILYLLVLFVPACYNKVYVNGHFSHRGSNTYKYPLQSFLDDSSFLFFDTTEKVPDSSIFIEKIEIKRNNLDRNFAYSPIFLCVQQSKEEARKVGANAVKVIEATGNNGLAYRIVAELYKIEEPYFNLYKRTVSRTGTARKDLSIVHLKNYWNGFRRNEPIRIYYNDSLIGACHRVQKINHHEVIDSLTAALKGNGSLHLSRTLYAREIALEPGHLYYVHLKGTYRYNEPMFQICSKYDF